MKKIFLVFILNAAFLLAEQNLKFEIVEKNNDNIKILITKEKEEKKLSQNTSSEERTETMYIVKKGDALSLIAKKFNVPMSYLIKINNIKNKDLIITNQKLILSE